MREKLGYGMALLVSSLIAKASLQFPFPSGNQQRNWQGNPRGIVVWVEMWGLEESVFVFSLLVTSELFSQNRS